MAVYGTPRNRMVAGPARAPRVPREDETSTTVPQEEPRRTFTSTVRAPREALLRMKGFEYAGIPTGTPTGTGGITSDESALIGAAITESLNKAPTEVTISGGGTGTSTAAKQRAQARREIKSIRDYLQSGKYREGLTGLLEAIKQQGEQRKTALTNLEGTGTYDKAKALALAGYADLKKYLEENAPTAYTNVPQAATAPIENALAQYMTAQQAPTTRAEAAVNLANMLGAGTTSKYNELLNLLKATEATGAEARKREAMLGESSMQAQLAALLLSRQSQIDAETAAARVAAERSAYERQQQLLDRILGLRRY